MMDRFFNSNKRNSANKESMSSTSGTIVKKRKYSYRKSVNGYRKFVFTTVINGEERPQCVLCKCHLKANHYSMVG